MGVSTELLVKQQVKASGDETVAALNAIRSDQAKLAQWISAVHEQQKRTNELLERLIGVMQGQPVR